jgi:hypothetical protein
MSTIIKLRVYKKVGQNEGLIRNEKGQVVNENQLVSLKWGTMECENYLSQLSEMGLAKVQVEKVYEQSKEGTKEIKEVPASDEILNKVAEAFKPKAVAEEDPRDREIAELRAQMKQMQEMFMGRQESVPETPTEDQTTKDPLKEEMEADESGNADSELEFLKDQYKQLVGRPAHHTWNKQTLIEKIKIAS